MGRRFTPETVGKTIVYLLDHRLLDDEAFSGQWISSRERLRPKGTRALKQELRQLGVDQTTIEEALEGIDEAANAGNAGRKLAVRLVDQDCSFEDFRRKVAAHLQRRGFAYGLISETVNSLWRELKLN